MRRYERHRDEASKRQAEAERAVREQLIESAARRERKFNELRSDIVEGHKLADEIQQHLSLQEMNARTKLKRQFDEWNDGVYGAIQDQINDRLDGMDSSEINRRRRHEFQKFLDTTNAKGAIFRDIIIESEYDPLTSREHFIRYRSARGSGRRTRVLVEWEVCVSGWLATQSVSIHWLAQQLPTD